MTRPPLSQEDKLYIIIERKLSIQNEPNYTRWQKIYDRLFRWFVRFSCRKIGVPPPDGITEDGVFYMDLQGWTPYEWEAEMAISQMKSGAWDLLPRFGITPRATVPVLAQVAQTNGKRYETRIDDPELHLEMQKVADAVIRGRETLALFR